MSYIAPLTTAFCAIGALTNATSTLPSTADAPKVAVRSQDDGWTGVLDEKSFADLHELKEGEAPELRGEEVEIAGMGCYLSEPVVGEPIGAVIVIHEWWGLNDHVKHWTDRLASDGYVALAVDLYDGVVATTRDGAMSAMRSVDQKAAIEKLRGAHAWLTDSEGRVRAERTGCIGWCFGGGYSLQLAIHEPELDAAVVYYGRLVTDVETLKAIEAPVLGVFGDQDSSIPPESVDAFEQAMDEAGSELTLRRYDAQHAFANPSSGRYDAENAAAAWRETRAFLCARLWPEPGGGSLIGEGGRQLELDAPTGWSRESENTSKMRLASFDVTADTSCVIFGFPGDVGGLVPNLNRWQGQMGAEDLTEDDADALPHIPVLGVLSPVLRTNGTYKDPEGNEVEDGALLAVYTKLDDSTVVVKMLGPRDEVDDASDEFLALCRSLR